MSHHSRNSWLGVVAELLEKKRRAGLPSAHRRLVAERLERRTVLSVAAVDDPNVSQPSLSEYLGQEHQLGPVAPPAPENLASDSALQAPSTSDSLNVVLEPASTDQFFSSYQPNGQAEGEGEALGSGSSVGSGSGVGSSSGSGSGTGSGSGSGVEAPPTISATQTRIDGVTTGITGSITDNSAIGDLKIDVDGPGRFSIDETGTFSIDLTGAEGSGVIMISVTDPLGGTSTYTFSY
jgi:hypothetical protein